jgi:hypothetical protein
MVFAKNEVVAIWIPHGRARRSKVWWLAKLLQVRLGDDDLTVRWFSRNKPFTDKTPWIMDSTWGEEEVGWKYVLVGQLKLDAKNRLTTESWVQIRNALDRHQNAYCLTNMPLDKYHQNYLFVDAAIATQKLLLTNAKADAKCTCCVYLDHTEFGTTRALLERECPWSSDRILVPQCDRKVYTKMCANEQAKSITLVCQTLNQLLSGVTKVSAMLADFTSTWSTCGPDIELAFSRKVFAKLAVLMITISLRSDEKFDKDDDNSAYKSLRRDILLAQVDVMQWAQINGYHALTRNIPDRSGHLQPAIINGKVAFLMFDIFTSNHQSKLKNPQINANKKPKMASVSAKMASVAAKMASVAAKMASVTAKSTLAADYVQSASNSRKRSRNSLAMVTRSTNKRMRRSEHK